MASATTSDIPIHHLPKQHNQQPKSSFNNSSTTSSAGEISMLAVFGKKVVTGCFGGVCQAVCSHPFDLIKSRIQSGTYPNISTTIKETLSKEGPTAFYKGVGPPIAIAGVYNAVLFASNETARKFLIKVLNLDPSQPLPLHYIMLSGVMAAPSACAILAPADTIKIQLQLQKEAKGKGAKYNGMLDCIVKIAKEDGPASLMRGYFPTLATRAFGLPFYFASNDLSRKFWKKMNPNTSDFATSLFSGMMNGWVFWCTVLPFDVLKTKVQGQHAVKGIKKKTAIEFAREIYISKGIRGFYLGLTATLIRSAPANASVFAAMDYGDRTLKKKFPDYW